MWTAAEDQITDASITLVELGTQESIGEFRNGRANGIPFGEYLLQVRRAGFKWYERRISIEHADVFARADLRVANTPSNRSTLMGRLTTDRSPTWIKLLPIVDHAASVVDAKVETDGTFIAGGIDDGDYVLVALFGSSVVFTRHLRIQGDISVNF